MKSRTSASKFLGWAGAGALAALAVCSAPTASGLEISLEENKAARGNIGYVDIHKVFRLFPETAKARQSYGEIVRQAEEQVNLRKAELLTLRSELSRLRLERELLEKTPIPVPPPPPPPPPPAATSPQASLPPADGAGASPGAVSPPEEAAPVAAKSEPLMPGFSSPSALGRLPGMSPSTGTPAAAGRPADEGADKALEPLVINIPGVTEKPIVVEAPPDGGVAPSGAPAGGMAHAAPPPASASEAAASQAEDALKARTAALAALGEKIAAKAAEVEEKERAFRAHQAQLEKDLLDIESRRSEMLLGRIYEAIRETARESGVSVVVDKSQILFGQNSVDLTEKVVKKLQELSQ